ncbi:hypothetical protein [Anaeroselena agilis]|uniref:Uncharacterized protein n=1 Tax=Anaeroselena agilis TaxID=3063788 RepID=A0ABU3P321_9FIRM|nr:hypothetical protein [Selenomonadales bacterium 4137-cl]
MATRQSGRGPRAAGNDSVVRVQADIRDGVEQERLKRYTREYKQSREIEEGLESLSRFACQPIDYVPAMTRKEWVEPAIPDFSYILVETRLKVTNKYLAAIATQVLGGLFFVILSLAFMDSFVPIIGIVGLAACTLALNRELQNRRREVDRALTEARADIERRVKELREKIAEERQAFEEAENQRIARIERLLNADPAAVFERIEEVLRSFKLPFYLRCTVDFYELEPLVTLYLPGHNVIPPNIVTLSQAGVIDYEEKTAPAINQQYSEAMAGTAVTLALLLYTYLPPLDVLYVRGVFDRGENPACYYCLRLTRQAALEVVEAPSALEAFRQLEARFEIGQNGMFTPIDEQLLPDWWEAAPREGVLATKLTIPSKF